MSGLPSRLFTRNQAITAMVLAERLGAGAWPALALVGSFELLMMLIRTGRRTRAGEAEPKPR